MGEIGRSEYGVPKAYLALVEPDIQISHAALLYTYLTEADRL